MWRGRDRFDSYTVNLDNGEKHLIKKALLTNIRLSPKGTYAYWYCPQDSSWYTYAIGEKKEYRLTNPTTFIAWNENNDVPDYPNPHGIAGWSTNDEYMLLYDRYDIWKFDPTNTSPPVNLTTNGRSRRISYRYNQLDKEEKSINLKDPLLLTGFNEATKEHGYYMLNTPLPSPPNPLLTGNFMLGQPIKAKNATAILYTTERFDQYPDLLLTDPQFQKNNTTN